MGGRHREPGRLDFRIAEEAFAYISFEHDAASVALVNAVGNGFLSVTAEFWRTR